MVKNTTGGNRAKSQARKHNIKEDTTERVPTSEFERVAYVSKMYGNGMCQIITTDSGLHLELLCHIRGKFKKNKKHNFVSLNSNVLVGLREYENPPKNCDLLEILPGSHIDTSFGSSGTDDILFSNGDTENKETEQIAVSTNVNISSSSIEEVIDFDDI
jgi:translation initiation factor IF-1